MAARKNQVLQDALDLAPTDRAELVEQILQSFDFPDREQVDALWAKEAEDRIDAYDKGRISPRPANRVFDRINQKPDA